MMNEVSIIINGVRYDAVKEVNTLDDSNCIFYDKEKGCKPCLIGMVTCEKLIGLDYVFKKSNKSFER